MVLRSSLHYVKNRVAYHWLKRPPTALELHQQCVRWDVARFAEDVIVEHPQMRGLWFARNCIDSVAIGRIKSLLATLRAQRRSLTSRYNWGRDMTPIHASPALDDVTARRITQGMDVFGEPGSKEADPVDGGWPRLAELVSESAEGATELEYLQNFPQNRIKDFQSEQCLFIVEQGLESGAEVGPHKDAVPCGGHMIATTVLEGTRDIKIGSVLLSVSPGDWYAIAHDARYDVEHEVLAGYGSRLSLTMRYGVQCRMDWDRDHTPENAWHL